MAEEERGSKVCRIGGWAEQERQGLGWRNVAEGTRQGSGAEHVGSEEGFGP